MFKINDTFRVEKDAHNWILVEKYMGTDKKGNEKEKERETYHSTLERLLHSMLDKAIEGDTLDKILEAIEGAKFDIRTSLKLYMEG